MRELSSVFVAWFAVFLMIMIVAIGRGEASYRDFLTWAASPVVVAVNVLALAFLVLHTVTWFALTPQAMEVRTRWPTRAACEGGLGRRQARAGGDGGAGRWPAGAGRDDHRLAVRGTRCGVGIHRLAGAAMTKRHLEPILWLLFSGGGVVAAVFLPILVVLFGLAVPWDGCSPTKAGWAVSLIGWPGWSCWVCSSSCCFTGRTGSGCRPLDGLRLRRLEAPDRCALLRRRTSRFARLAVDRLNCILIAAPSGTTLRQAQDGGCR